jgi:hypothetical protein
MNKLCVVALTVALSLIVGPSLAQDAADHDLECLVSMKAPEASPDEKTRWGASAVATFYLGRLDQTGLTLEQIQTGVERILLSRIMYQETQKKDFSDQCFRDVNNRVNVLRKLEARDKERLREKLPR